MTRKPVVRRAIADRDVEAIIDHYLATAGSAVALRFVDDLEDALGHVSRFSGTGSPRYAQRLALPGLRTWNLRDFPYMVFYFERAQEIELWRVLHGRMDIPDWLPD